MVVVTKKYNPIKLKLGQLKLKNYIKKQVREVKVCSLSNAKTVGILFAINNQDSLNDIREMLKKMQKKGIQTYALGYIPVKKPDDFYLSQKGFNFFSDSDLNFFLIPTSEAANEFINTEFDVLIDIYSEQYFPTNYIINMSKAGLKVGCFCESKPFDIMINVENKTNINYYFEQVIHYLEKIK